jgi:hypothetical protein
VRFYQAAEDSTPQKKYAVGLNYLQGNMPRQAEEYINGAFMEGHRSAEVAYHWTLAVLSGRSFDHLADEDFHKLSTAFAASLEYPASHWKTAVGVIYQLIQCLIAQEKRGAADPVEFGAVLTAYNGLADDRRDEIRRHLEMILAGGIQDQLAELDATEVAELRMGGDRRGRAWKFFEADPAPARERTADPPAPGLGTWARCVAGGVLALSGLVILASAGRSVVDLDTAQLDEERQRKLTFAHALKLRLSNGQVIHVLVENFDLGLIDRVQEDSRYLLELARDSSGITSAVRILEAVAAEGREWIDHEQARRQRRLAAYQQKNERATAMLGEATLRKALPADSGDEG